MTLQKSYEIVIFDNDKEKFIKYLPIHIKAENNDLHEKIIKFIESENKDKTTRNSTRSFIFNGYGSFIKQPNRVENVYKNAVNTLKRKTTFK
jgi:hypothetical protein